MSGKLDIALDDIVKEKRQNSRRPRRVARSAKPTTTAAGPATGIKKTKSAKATTKKVTATPAAAPAATTTGSKIIVSNLPMDVTEAQIKDYFVQTIGPIKKVSLTYGPNGQSRGVATIIFSNAAAAAEAAKLLDGTKVDGRPMKVEVVLGAKQAPTPARAKALSERIQATKPIKSTAKNQPKTVTTKDTKNTKSKKTTRGRNAGRPKKKTAEELDTEMNDYFATGTDANAGGAVQPVANGGDAAMEEVS